MTENYFPIRILAERTGVGHSTLRAWERRHALLTPHRTPKGHRLYTKDDVQLINRVLELLKEGHSISSASAYVQNSATAGAASQGPIMQTDTVSQPVPIDTPWQGYLEQMLHAVEDFSNERLDAVYNEASSLYPLELISSQLVVPALDILGMSWRSNAVAIGQEHFFSAWLRNKLGARLHHSASLSTGSTIVVACVPEHHHEIGALLFTLAALGRGYRAVYLGSNMPLSPLPYIVERSRAKALVLIAGEMTNFEPLLSELKTLKSSMTQSVFVGGPMAAEKKEMLIEAGIESLGNQLSLAAHVIYNRVPVH